MLFGMEGGLDSFNCNSPMGDAAYNDPSRFDHMADAIGDVCIFIKLILFLLFLIVKNF